MVSSRTDPPLRLAAGVDPLAHARAWVDAPALADLILAFGGEPPRPGDDLGASLAALDAFSERWDFRAGRERNEVAAATLTDARVTAIDRAARALGQQDQAPPSRREWDQVIVLGGLLRACLARPAITAQMLEQGDIAAGTITALAAFRRLNDTEAELGMHTIDVVPADEIDAMTLGMRRAFDLDGPFVVRGEQYGSEALSWEERTYDSTRAPTLRVVAAPAEQPGRRATTPQALAWFARTMQLEPGTSVLIVTTEIYRHYHAIEGIRALALPYGSIVDAVGMSPGDVDPRLTLEFTPMSRAQEIRSSIRALRSLVADLTA
jgi:hypothetical protein